MNSAHPTPALSIQAAVKDYDTKNGPFRAVNGLSLDIAQGEFFGLLGPNGAGKTSLISMIAGLASTTGGKIKVMGHDVTTDFRAARRALGLVPQELVFDPFFTVQESLRNQSGYFGVRNNQAWIDEILEGLGLTDKAHSNMRALSGGMKRRVLIAQALVHKPPLIVLDEPTAGVDVELRQTLWRFVRRLHGEGHTIVLTTHYLEEAEELCGRIAMMQKGQIVALDTTANLLKRFAGLQLVVRLSGELPDGLKPRLSTQTGGSKVGDRLRLRLTSYDEVTDILMQLRTAGLRVEEVEVQRADLEDVFLQVMHGQNSPI